MKNKIIINKKIKKFNKSIKIEGDKSLSIRWALLASQATGISKCKNLLMSEDVLNTLSCLRKLGVSIKFSNKECIINGKGLNSYQYKKNLILNASKEVLNYDEIEVNKTLSKITYIKLNRTT